MAIQAHKKTPGKTTSRMNQGPIVAQANGKISKYSGHRNAAAYNFHFCLCNRLSLMVSSDIGLQSRPQLRERQKASLGIREIAAIRGACRRVPKFSIGVRRRFL